MDTPMLFTINSVLLWQMIEKVYKCECQSDKQRVMLFESGNNGIDICSSYVMTLFGQYTKCVYIT
jgi:hypothetical protein